MSDLSLRYLLFGEDRSASKAITGVASKGSKAAQTIGGAFSRIGSQVGGEVGQLVSTVGAGLAELGEHAGHMGAKLMAGGSAITGLGVALQLAGSHEQQTTQQLDAAIDASGHKHEQYAEDIEKAIKAQENFGHGASDTNEALRKLTQATNDPKRALESMGLVANIAAAKHISLSDAATLVAKIIGGKGAKVLAEYGIKMDKLSNQTKDVTKAQGGVTKASQQLHQAQQSLLELEEKQHQKKKLTLADHIALEHAQEKVRAAALKLKAAHQQLSKAQQDNAKNTQTVQGALDQLGHKVNGQASAAVDTFAGKLGVIKTKLGDWVATMGQKLGPALTVAGPVIMGVGAIVEAGGVKAAIAAVKWLGHAAAVTATTTASLIAKGASLAWAGAQLVLNAALNANPIGLIVLAIVGLVAVFVLAWKHSEKFRAIVTGALHAVTGAFGAALSWIKSHWVLLLGILTGPIGPAIVWITQHWSTITGVFGRIVSNIGTAVGKVTDVITAPFRMAFNAVADLWNGTVGRLSFSVPSWVPGLGGKGFSMPKLPHLAAGALITGPTVALLGEAGPEAVVPLSAGRARGAFGGAGTVVNVVVHGFVGSETQLAAQLAQVLNTAAARGAKQTLKVRLA